MTMSLVRYLSVSFLLVLVCVGCKSNPAIHVSQAPSAAMPAGFTPAVSKDGAVTLGVASGWRFGVDKMFEIGDLGNMGLDQSDVNNPDIKQMAEGMNASADADQDERLEALYKKGFLLHIINGSKPIPGEARTRYVVQRFESDGNWDFAQAENKERGEYAFKPQRQDVTLPIGKVVKLWGTEELRNGGVRHRISYLAIDGKKLYVLRFTTDESKDTIFGIADSVAQTWRIQPGK